MLTTVCTSRDSYVNSVHGPDPKQVSSAARRHDIIQYFTAGIFYNALHLCLCMSSDVDVRDSSRERAAKTAEQGRVL